MASTLKIDTIQLPDGSTPTAADLGIDVAGTVVQVVHSDIMPSTAGSSTNILTLGSVSFTPKYANSVIHLSVLGGKMNHNTAISATHVYYFYRDGVQLTYRHEWANTANYDKAHNLYFVDTPNTTSTITYSYRGQANGGGWLVHDTTQPTRMVITEIAQ